MVYDQAGRQQQKNCCSFALKRGFETIYWYGELFIPEVSQRLPSILAEVHGL
jgi:hypothetical protein